MAVKYLKSHLKTSKGFNRNEMLKGITIQTKKNNDQIVIYTFISNGKEQLFTSALVINTGK